MLNEMYSGANVLDDLQQEKSSRTLLIKGQIRILTSLLFNTFNRNLKRAEKGHNSSKSSII